MTVWSFLKCVHWIHLVFGGIAAAAASEDTEWRATRGIPGISGMTYWDDTQSLHRYKREEDAQRTIAALVKGHLTRKNLANKQASTDRITAVLNGHAVRRTIPGTLPKSSTFFQIL